MERRDDVFFRDWVFFFHPVVLDFNLPHSTRGSHTPIQSCTTGVTTRIPPSIRASVLLFSTTNHKCAGRLEPSIFVFTSPTYRLGVSRIPLTDDFNAITWMAIIGMTQIQHTRETTDVRQSFAVIVNSFAVSWNMTSLLATVKHITNSPTTMGMVHIWS